MTGTIKPSGKAKADPICMWLFFLMKSPIQLLFTSGCKRSAAAHALIIISLNETFTGLISFIAMRAAIALSMFNSMVK